MKPLMAVAQMTSTEDIEVNFNSTQELCERAKEHGAALICFPENFAYLGQSFSDRGSMSEPLEGPLFSRYRQLAKKYSIHVSFGGFQEKGKDGQNFNTHIVVDKNAQIVAAYRKIHLFKAHLAGQNPLDESLACVPGDKVIVADTPFAKLGLSICYDLRFAEMYNKLANLGAHIMLIPAAFTVPTGEAHWETLVRARAIENQCYVLAAAQCGRHNASRSSYGHAMIIDPWGKVIDCCHRQRGLAFAHFDMDYLREVRERIPMQSHRRPQLFR